MGVEISKIALSRSEPLSGVPHRIGHVQRTFEEILSRDGVVAWDGSRILDWYLAQQTPARIGIWWRHVGSTIALCFRST
jgi:hypothetical protein